MSSKYSIKDLERLTGIKAHTLRIWEQRYDILQPERTDTNIRFYNGNDLRKILNVSLLNNNGYKISAIAKLSGPAILTEAEKFLNNYNKESDQVDNLVISLIDVNEELFEKTINNSILKFGFENTFEKIIFPFLKHLGNMWLAGIINPAQEHYISNLIRQKLIVGIDNIKIKSTEKSKSYVFFLPDQELHEIGLLYCYYLTKVKGNKCSYLGQSLPLEDLSLIVNAIKPDFLVTILTSSLPDIQTSEFLKNYSEKIKEPKSLISGRLIISEKETVQLPQKFKIFQDFQDFKNMI